MRKLYILFILLIGFQCSYAQDKVLTFDRWLTSEELNANNGVIEARDKVILKPGFIHHGGQVEINLKTNPDLICDASYQTEINPDTREISTSLPVGTLPGSHGVTPTGALTYTVPLDLPAGTAGMQPNLSVGYTSQGGNGIMGIGWNLSGLSQINRTPKNLFTDGTIDGVDMDLNDRFALDGNRLIAVNGTYGVAGSEYVLEIQNFSKIYANGTTGNGPTWFKVETKDGRTLEYGRNSDSRVMLSGKSTVLAWKLNKVYDVYGNYMTFTYKNLDGENIIDKIEYTGNDTQGLDTYNTVEFYYEKRADQSSFYVADGKINQTALLYEIKVISKDNLLRTYKLKYKNERFSFLTEIMKYGINEATRFNSTYFNWTDGGNESFTHPGEDPVLESFGRDAGGWQVGEHPRFLADVTGDGKDDIIGFGGIKVYVSESTGNDFSWPWSFDGFCDNWDHEQHIRTLADVNGDGMADIVGFADDGVHVSFSTGNGFTLYQTTPHLNWFGNSSSAGGFSLNQHPRYLADFNGDGRADIIGFSDYGVYVAKSTGDDFETQYKAGTGTDYGSGWSSQFHYRTVADVNGDGMADIVGFADNGVHVSFSDGQNFSPDEVAADLEFFGYGSGAGSWSVGEHPRFMADVNGDGKADIVGFAETGVFVSLSTGTDFTAPVEWIHDYGRNLWNPDLYPRFLADVNGDNLADIVAYGEEGTYVSLSTGTDFTDKKLWVPEFGHNTTLDWNPEFHPRQVADIDGDGKVDLIGFSDDGVYISHSNSSEIQKLANVSNGLNNNVSFEYKPLTVGGDFYTKSTGATYPIVDIQVPHYAVYRIKEPDGQGGTSKTYYSYSGAKLHKAGRGFLGFETISYRNDLKDLKIVDEYINYSGPLSLAVKEKTVSLANGTNLISKTTYNHYGREYDDGSFFHYVTSSSTIDYLNNETTNVDYVYDYWGNVGIIETEYSDGSFTKVYTGYKARPGSDVLSLPTGKDVTTYIENEGSQGGAHFEETHYSYNSFGSLDYVEGPLNSSKKIITSYTYDDFGNVETTTVEDYLGEGYTTSFDYDSERRYLTENINTLGFITKNEYDDYGNLVKTTDENGLTTKFSYDSFNKCIKTTLASGNTVNETSGWLDNGGFYSLTSGEGMPDSKVYFDEYGRKMKVETVGLNNQKILTEYAYDSKGRVYKSTLPYYDGDAKIWNEKSFDAYGRVISVSGQYIDNTYSYSSNSVTATNNLLNSATTKVTNSMGLVKSVTDPGGTINYVYSGFGTPAEIITPDGVVSIEYDEVGNRTLLSDPDAGNTSYAYNNFSELVSQTDANGNVNNMTYDELGRMLTKTGPDGTTTYFYDGVKKGLLDKITHTNGITYEYFYDDLGRISQYKETIDGNAYTYDYAYDSFGNEINVIYPSGFEVDKQYDANGYLIQLRNANADALIWELNEVDALGQITASKYGNNLIENKSIINNRITGISSNGFEEYYTYNTNGVLESRQNGFAVTESFTYDNLNRLETYQIGSGETKTMVYDLNGNITEKPDVGTFNYGENAGPHALTSVTGNTAISANEQNIQYTAFHKISNITENNISTTFTYGPDQARKKVVYENNSVVEKTKYYVGLFEKEVFASGITRELNYVNSPDGIIAVDILEDDGHMGIEQMYYIHKDYLGSFRALTDQNQNVVEEYAFDAWGNRRDPDTWGACTQTNFIINRGYTGHEHLDDYNLINMNGRVYDPVVGRFLNTDNFVQNSEFTQNFNRYSYCYNNPLLYTDPDGEWVNILIGGIIGSVSGTLQAVGESNDHSWGLLWDGVVGGHQGGVVGAVSGAVGGEVGGIVGGCLGSGLVSSVASGAASGLTAGFISGTANGLMYDMSLGDALLNGVETGAIGIVAGGVGGGAGSFIDGYGFFAGALSGAAGGASGGFVGGAISGWSSGENFGDGLVSGINAAWKGAIIGGVAGGISSGISSYGSDRSFWTGAPQQEVVLKINLAGEGELVSLSDYRNSSAETRAYYRTLLRNNDAITTNSRGVTNIKLPRNISRVNGIEAEGGFVDPDASFEIGRRNISVTFIETPNYINLYGYRYQSNTSSFSLKNLIYH